ncbi:MAG: hypothetical protein WB562_18695, partial [Candidatus Sulfotelmatobacter sp.]
SVTPENLGNLLRGFSIPESGKLDSVEVVLINAPGNIAFLTTAAMQTLRETGRVTTRCAINS